jgi:hypothetical protein
MFKMVELDIALHGPKPLGIRLWWRGEWGAQIFAGSHHPRFVEWFSHGVPKIPPADKQDQGDDPGHDQDGFSHNLVPSIGQAWS